MNQAQLNAIKERLAKATPGPWESEETAEGHIEILSPNENYTICQMQNENIDCLNEGDTEFIKHAITDVPALVDEVERLQNSCELYEVARRNDGKMIEHKNAEIKKLREALEQVMEVEAPIAEGWETCAYKIARQALGGEAHE